MLALLVAGCSAALVRHAETLLDSSVRARVVASLSELDRLERTGWIARIRSGACRRTWGRAEDRSEPPTDDVIAMLGWDERRVETTEPRCRAALDALDELAASRAELERDVLDDDVLAPFARAVEDVSGTRTTCDTAFSPGLAALVAIVRHVAELDPRTDWTIHCAPARCEVATLGRPVRIDTEPAASRVGTTFDPFRTEPTAAADCATCDIPERSLDLYHRGAHGVEIQHFDLVETPLGWRVIDAESAGHITLTTAPPD